MADVVPVPPNAPLDVLVVSHTHWDREWYRTAEEFRQLLVSLIDELLDQPGATPFLLDGQSILLSDYIEIRPERAAELRSAFREGRLEAGPWFVLSDELIPSAEALIRNLLAGRRVLRSVGATAPPLLYSPDAFGHPAALPELAHGFGAGAVLLWRGYGGLRWPAGDTVRWKAPSGRDALLVHLAPDGYELGASLPTTDDAARARWNVLRGVLAPRARLGVAFLPNGADHHARQRNLPAALAALARAASPDRLRASSIVQLTEEIVSRSAASPLPVVCGELRDSYGYTWTLGGTLGSRASQKRRNSQLERLLIRDVEPWVAFMARRGDATAAALADAAWRTLLACHPHDSLCGCSTDDVAAAVDARFMRVAHEGTFLRDRTLLALLGHEPDDARERVADWRTVVILRNRTARTRSGVAQVVADLPLAHVRVGRGSTSDVPTIARARVLQLLGASRAQLLSRERIHLREEAPRSYPRDELTERQRTLVWVDDVPAYGGLVLRSGRPAAGLTPPASSPRTVSNGIANDTLSVEVVGAGLTIRGAGRVIPEVVSFETDGDRGDLYTPSPIPGSHRAGALLSWRVTARGPLRAELTTRWQVPVAERTAITATGDRKAHTSGSSRVRVRIQLDAGSDFVRFLVDGDWAHSDARLRVRIQTGLTGATTWADAMFGDVERRPLDVPAPEQVAEQVQRGAPLHRFVSRYSPKAGVTLVSDGLAEYEAATDGSVAVTLVRAVGDLSRANLPERPGHAGWPVATPAAQCRAPYDAMFALALHGPRTPDRVVAVHNLADAVLLPLAGSSWRSAIDPPPRFTGAALDGDGLVLSAIKASEDRSWTVLRCVNVLDEWVSGCWRLDGLTDAVLARLDETPLGALIVIDGAVSFSAPPRAVVTVLVR
jgi:hypothetical protein